jgi:hypothetical protein
VLPTVTATITPHLLHLPTLAGEHFSGRRSVRNEKAGLTTTLITKLLTNPLAKARSRADASDQSLGLGPVHHTRRLSMAWKRSGVRVP